MNQTWKDVKDAAVTLFISIIVIFGIVCIIGLFVVSVTEDYELLDKKTELGKEICERYNQTYRYDYNNNLDCYTNYPEYKTYQVDFYDLLKSR